jgi:hypothetical protein
MFFYFIFKIFNKISHTIFKTIPQYYLDISIHIVYIFYDFIILYPFENEVSYIDYWV